MSAIFLTLLTAVLPILETTAIPVGLGLGLPPFLVFWLALIGNLLPVLPVLYTLHHGIEWLERRVPFVHRLIHRALSHTRLRHGHKFDTFGFAALILLVAIPSPFAGVWTASVISYLLQMPIKKSFFAILIGSIIANIIIITAGVGVKALL